MPRVLVPVAPGFEEIETVTIVDILRRAQIEVVLAGVVPGVLTGSRGIRVEPDCPLDQVLAQAFDLIVLPGGKQNALALRDDPRVRSLVTRQLDRGALVGAICAAPLALAAYGVLDARRATAHPAVREDLARVQIVNDRVVVSDRVITSQGPGTAIEFAFALIERLLGAEKVREVNAGVLAKV
jgi:4-methyl-5(b-hydroxyethyl)-thiazole monophosphate biosynthesis